MRGRKPKPLRIQIAEGDTRKRGVNKLKELAESEPKAERGLPPCPVHLMGRARDAWHFWSEELAQMKLDHRPDAQALECLCSAYALASTAADGCTTWSDYPGASSSRRTSSRNAAPQESIG